MSRAQAAGDDQIGSGHTNTIGQLQPDWLALEFVQPFAVFDVSDVANFDFQHSFPNSHFSIIFIFQRIASKADAFCSGTPVALACVGNGSNSWIWIKDSCRAKSSDFSSVA